MSKFVWSFFLLFFFGVRIAGTTGNHWENVKIVTEDLAPLGYIDKNDKQLKGETVELVSAALRYLGVPVKIEVYPWARALNMAQNEKNVFIFNLARTPERENKYHWVFQTKTKKMGVFALKTRKEIQIKNLNDLKKYKLVVLNQNISHLFLLQKGFEKAPAGYFHAMDSEAQIIQFLYNGRADLWIKTYLNEKDEDDKIRKEGQDPKKLEKKMDIHEMKIDLYLAASLKTPGDKIKKMRQALKAVAQKGK